MNVAGHLSISFDQLAAKGQELVAKADDLQAQMDALRAVAQPDGIWQGLAASAYQEEFDRWAASQRTMIDALREMGSFLQRAAEAYAGTDEEIRRALGLAA